MQIRSFRGSGEPAWVIAPSSAGKRLGPDPRRALGPAATPAASTGRTRDRTRPMLQKRQKVLARAPSTRDPRRKWLIRRSSPSRSHTPLRRSPLNLVISIVCQSRPPAHFGFEYTAYCWRRFIQQLLSCAATLRAPLRSQHRGTMINGATSALIDHV